MKKARAYRANFLLQNPIFRKKIFMGTEMEKASLPIEM